ncbi:MAG: universal stress protein [Streptosporangiaceae bacterium]|nr:universal stress protein [Streptosporangiaceae bacterium]
MSTPTPPPGNLHLVVGYDGSPPAIRALDAAIRLLSGRTGRVEVVYVGHLSSTVMLSPGAVAEMESEFGDLARDLRAEVEEKLRDQPQPWDFQMRQGLIAEELIAAAESIRDAHPEESVVIVVGSSSHATHRVVGSVAVSLARHSPVPLVVVP